MHYVIYKYNVYILNLKKHCSEKKGYCGRWNDLVKRLHKFPYFISTKTKVIGPTIPDQNPESYCCFQFCIVNAHPVSTWGPWGQKCDPWVSIFIKYGKFWITSLSHIIKHKLLISEECKYSFTDVLLKLSLWCNNFKTG